MKIEIYLSDKRLCRDKESKKIEFNEMVRLAMSRRMAKYLFRYEELIIYSRTFNALPSPFLAVCICRLICKGRAEWQNEKGEIRKIRIGLILKLLLDFTKEHITYRSTIKKISVEVNELSATTKKEASLFVKRRPLFLRMDLTFGIVAGGSVGHVSGVVNNLEKFSGSPILVSSDSIPTVRADIDTVLLNGEIPYRNVIGIAALVYNLVSYPVLDNLVRHNGIAFIYQRSSLYIYSGVKLAIIHHLPYVLEYNSGIRSYVYWGNNNLKYLELAKKIELLTFEYADLITCVSEPLRQELIDQGVDADKIIVTPNGVDPVIYHPGIDGQTIRKKYHIKSDEIVIGFIGTFGKWHGTEILAEAFGELKKKYNNIRLLMMGDGVKIGEVKQIIHSYHMEKYVILTGMIPQKEGPLYLAACDILVSPTLKNQDESNFFGSPTKLFEYMAMGKGIVTSNIGQMAEILKDEETALLTEPNNVSVLGDAIERLLLDTDLRWSLGRKAREEVCNKYTWEMHTGKIVAALEERMERG